MLRFYIGLFLFATTLQLSSTAQDSTYRGKEFWAGYGHHQFMESGTNSQSLVFYLSTLQDAATVTITIDSCATPWSRTYFIPANTVIISDTIPRKGPSDARLFSQVPAFGGASSTGIFRKKGIHIESTVPIAVYSHIYGSASSGASLLLPVQTWGYSYQSLNSKQSYASNCYSWAYAIASEDSTTIEIIPSVLTRAQDLTGLKPGISSILTLHKGQVYQVLGANTGADTFGNGGASQIAHELTGTIIRSLSPGKPIGVYSGSSRTLNPANCGSGGGDNDMAQVFPLHVWGYKYVTAPLSASNNAAYMATGVYKILVSDSTTVVTKNGVVLTGLLNNSYYLYESNTADYIEADKPVIIAQFMTGAAGCTTGVSDPDMYYLSPIHAGVKNVNCVRTSKEGITINYVTLIIPTSGITSLTIDGSPTFSHSYPHPQLNGYSVVIKNWVAPVTVAQLNIQSDSAFTGVTYGMGPVESYGYNLGANFKANNGLDPMVPMVWRGGFNTNWFNPDNWNIGKVPTATDHVVIPPGTTFSPAIPDGFQAICKSILVQNGASINIATNARLNVTGKKQ